jgi:hypothetical protein
MVSFQCPYDVIPVLDTGITPFAVQFTFKNECSYSYVSATCMTSFVVFNKLGFMLAINI